MKDPSPPADGPGPAGPQTPAGSTASEAAAARERENREWAESLDYVLRGQGPARVRELLRGLQNRAVRRGVTLPFSANTPYVNTIPREEQPPFPGDRELERRIKSIIRWNAMAMVVRANRVESGIGGHISTYASAATLLEIGFNHFFRGNRGGHEGDLVYFQGHAAPGVYARAFLEGRLSERDLENFRRELGQAGGLPSYPHPWLMPGFWQFPTVSMGLAPLLAIYQARFNRYLEDRGLAQTSHRKVWAFLGDGEMDEPESLGAITLAAREKLDNLIFVVNCNLQRLDGPVRGNGKIIQELEAAFRGAGWNVIKVIWGGDWDPLLARDDDGLLAQRMEEIVDGESQRHAVIDGGEIRREFFGKHPALLDLVRGYSDEQLHKLKRGGHDPEKVYAAYRAAVEHRGAPSVVLAKTIKGYGLGEAGEGRNVTHQQKKLNEQELREFRSRFGIPIADEDVAVAPFYRPPEGSPELRYLQERRRALGGYLPERVLVVEPLAPPPAELFAEYLQGTGDREVSTTMVFVHLLGKLLRDGQLGRLVVPIVPDEARTFGMESLFRQIGIYSHVGQLYEPVDKESLLYYNERRDGAILEEGINEAGAMSSFIAAGTAYATHGINTIPFFIYYSMFGFQRVGDLIWAAGDMQAKGFLVGGTSGRTTLAGEGLQHQDGNSHVLALPVPNLRAYDPAFAYELALIIRDGIERMYVRQEKLFYYLTVTNEAYAMPPLPTGAQEGVLRGVYRLRPAPDGGAAPRPRVQLLGSGAILREVLAAQELLADRFSVASDVWSVTSWKELYRDAIAAERHNLLRPEAEPRTPWLASALAASAGSVFVAATDYVRALPLAVARWIPGRLRALGTDGYGRSDGRASLRDFFEVDARYVALAALTGLAEEGDFARARLAKAARELDIDPDKLDPLTA